MSPELPLVPMVPTPDAASDPAGGPAQDAVPPAPMWAAGQIRTMTAEEAGAWTGRLDDGEAFRKDHFEAQWDRALKSYARASYPKRRADINTLQEYSHVETKKAHLFHRTPEVQLAPIDPPDPQVPWQVVLPLRQKYLNATLGPTEAHVKRQFHKALVDALAASGWLVFEIGYERRGLPVPPDPLTGQARPDVTMWAACFANRVSPKKTIVPADWHDTDFDAAPWLAIEGTITRKKAVAIGWTIPADLTGTTQRDEARFDHGLTGAGTPTDPRLRYRKVWFRAAEYDDAVWHPDLFRVAVFVDGADLPVYYADSPYQDLDLNLDPENPTIGELTPDSMIGNPIHMGVLRDLPDSAYVPCDLTIGEQLASELNGYRTDLVRGRRNRQTIVLVSDAVGQPLAEKILKERGAVVPAEYVQPGGQQSVIAVVQAGTESRDNYAAQDVIKHDWQTGIGASDARAGQTSQAGKTISATEIRAVAGGAAARDRTEQDNARDCFIGLVRKFDALEQRFATPRRVEKILGAAHAQLWAQWRTLPGRYSYTILPDAGAYTDAKEFLDHTLQTYNLLRKDERVVPEELLQMVALALHRDPSKLIAPPRPPTPDPTTTSISFKAEDLVTSAAIGSLAVDLLAQQGTKISPETLTLLRQAILTAAVAPPVATDHGGAADRTEPVNQHAADRTGRVPGSVQ